MEAIFRFQNETRKTNNRIDRKLTPWKQFLDYKMKRAKLITTLTENFKMTNNRCFTRVNLAQSNTSSDWPFPAGNICLPVHCTFSWLKTPMVIGSKKVNNSKIQLWQMGKPNFIGKLKLFLQMFLGGIWMFLNVLVYICRICPVKIKEEIFISWTHCVKWYTPHLLLESPLCKNF